MPARDWTKLRLIHRHSVNSVLYADYPRIARGHRELNAEHRGLHDELNFQHRDYHE